MLSLAWLLIIPVGSLREPCSSVASRPRFVGERACSTWSVDLQSASASATDRQFLPRCLLFNCSASSLAHATAHLLIQRHVRALMCLLLVPRLAQLIPLWSPSLSFLFSLSSPLCLHFLLRPAARCRCHVIPNRWASSCGLSWAGCLPGRRHPNHHHTAQIAPTLTTSLDPSSVFPVTLTSSHRNRIRGEELRSTSTQNLHAEMRTSTQLFAFLAR